jgi:GTP-binding protein
MSGKLPIVAVVGRPNVGKSTFFNRILGRRLAIVDDRPGVTRDRNFARADWAGRHFFIVDTGGVIEGSDEPLDRAVREQALAAVAEADVIVFLVDGKDGPHPMDERIAEILRKARKPVLLVVNKVDNLGRPEETSWLDFWSLGIGEPIPVAAASGKGTGDLLDKLLAALPDAPTESGASDEIRVAVVGRPNVGKSSFVNRIFGEERMVVSEIAGTTRDPVDSPLTYHGHRLVFVDTAGLRRQSKVSDSLEYYSALRTARVLQEADVALVLLDAVEGLHVQDLKIAEMAWESGCGIVLAVNKWDLVEKDTQTAPDFEKQARERAPFLQWVPILFTSALTGLRVHKAFDLVLQVQEQRLRRIETHEVNDVIEELMRRQPPPHSRGRQVKLKYGTQVDVEPPSFVLFSNLPREIPDHYIRYVMNGFRERWQFLGSPIRIQLRASAPTSRTG